MGNTVRNTLFLMLIFVVTGCAQNYYNIPRETYEKKVRVLGVAPLMLDADSDIRHPEKTDILTIIREANRKNEKELVEILKNNGEYFSVRLIDDEAGQLFASLVSRRERRDDAGVVYNKYFYKPDEIKKYVTADSLAYLSLEGLRKIVPDSHNYCTACFDCNYPISFPGAHLKQMEFLFK